MSEPQGVSVGSSLGPSGVAAEHRAAVLGHPVGHSLSPALHRAAYAALDLADWRYDAVDVTAEQLPGFVADLDSTWAGLSLTMPLKQTVLPLLDHIEPLAEVVGAVNTVLIQGAGARRMLVGANTDVYGLVAALREGLERGRGGVAGGSRDPVPAARARTAAVLGAGATAASTLAALAQLGCPTPVVYVRSLGRIGSLMRAAHRMGVEPRYALLPTAAKELATFDLVVSTLPAHAADAVADEVAGTATTMVTDMAANAAAATVTDMAANTAAATVTDMAASTTAATTASTAAETASGIGFGVLLDVVYEPRPTALSVAWTAAGGVTVGGERMLLHQAVEQVRLMTGRIAPVASMEQALARALST